MGRKKLVRFARNADDDKMIEPGKEIYGQVKGNWQKKVFKNNKPLILELGCGRGEYSVGLARKFPDFNFIGADIKGDRMYVGARIAREEGLENVAFLRCYIQNIAEYFDQNEVAEIWVTFPDPRPKNSDRRRRLTNDRFLKMYHEILAPFGILHLKTDDPNLFDYSLERLDHFTDKFRLACYTKDLYQEPVLLNAHFGVQTHYEKVWTAKGRTINYFKSYCIK